MELDSRVKPSVSHTTRAPRGQEKHGREYFFVSQQNSTPWCWADAFVEWAHVHGHRYGTSKKAIEDRMAQGLGRGSGDRLPGRHPDQEGVCQRGADLHPAAELGRTALPAGAPRRGRAEVIDLRLRNAALEMAQVQGIRLRYNQRVI
jgi:guanylate kinase